MPITHETPSLGFGVSVKHCAPCSYPCAHHKTTLLSHIICLSLFIQVFVNAMYAENFEWLKYVTQPITESQNYISDT